MRRWFFSYLLFAILPAGDLRAFDNPFLGQWTIQSSIVAPWSPTEMDNYDPAKDMYLNKDVGFEIENMTGPGWFECSSPAYIVELLPADIVFQGGLGIDPAAPTSEPDDNKAMEAASKLGLDRINILTLENRCSELALHMVDENTLLFAADNRIYTLKRKPN